jgi:UDP-2,3-diacylglucosamine hydrolase
MTTRFISDLHLSATRPDITELFEHFLQHEARQSDALYILGDLFDAWIGDDDLTPFHVQVMDALRDFTSQGIPTYFIAGNRDFLIGTRFARYTGVTLLPETCVVDLYGTPTLLMHGDTLCTLDTGYLRFRKIIRQPWLIKVLTALPLSWRRGIANRLRRSSKSQQPLTADQLATMDAQPEAVRDAMQTHQVSRLIHGHTHRPGVHQHALHDGSTGERIVLGDWYEQGSILDVDAHSYNLREAPLSLSQS